MKENILLELKNKDIVNNYWGNRYYDIGNLFVPKVTVLKVGGKFYWLDNTSFNAFKISTPEIIGGNMPCWKPLIP